MSAKRAALVLALLLGIVTVGLIAVGGHIAYRASVLPFKILAWKYGYRPRARVRSSSKTHPVVELVEVLLASWTAWNVRPIKSENLKTRPIYSLRKRPAPDADIPF